MPYYIKYSSYDVNTRRRSAHLFTDETGEPRAFETREAAEEYRDDWCRDGVHCRPSESEIFVTVETPSAVRRLLERDYRLAA